MGINLTYKSGNKDYNEETTWFNKNVNKLILHFIAINDKDRIKQFLLMETPIYEIIGESETQPGGGTYFDFKQTYPLNNKYENL